MEDFVLAGPVKYGWLGHCRNKHTGYLTVSLRGVESVYPNCEKLLGRAFWGV